MIQYKNQKKTGANIVAQIRLDKFLSDAASISRSDARQYIKHGRVAVGSEAVKKFDMKIDSGNSEVFLDGKRVTYRKNVYIMLNKPSGVVSATEDKTEKTVLDLLPEEYKKRGVFPVGRLDKDTTGLLLLTDDGDFAHKIVSPRNKIKKTYAAVVAEDITDEDITAFAEGITLADGTNFLTAELCRVSEKTCTITICEGKYHQVKRMIASRGNRVTALCRLSVGGLVIDENLSVGEFTEITAEKIELIFS